MKLFVIILCLLSERFLMHSLSYKRFTWFEHYCKKIAGYAEQHHLANPWILLIVFILPLTLIVSLIYLLLHGIFFGFFGFILSLLIFFYCLGPDNPFYPSSETTSPVGNYLAKVNSQLFSVIFWYLIGGPILTLIYRLCSLCRSIPAVSIQANQLADVLEWLPARLTVLLYLLVGNFQRGLSLFMQYFVSKPSMNEQLLADCGLQALQTSEKSQASMADAERLVEHALFILLVLIALLTLMARL